jgi:nitroreductase
MARQVASTAVDAYLAIASRREVRSYSDRPVPEDVQRRILDAGRVSGSSQNRQQWRFVWVTDRGLLERVAEVVFVPGNLRGCAFAVAIAVSGKGPTSFDAGRAAQNMMLAAWNEGVGSSPNGMPDRAAAGEVLGLSDGEEPVIVLTFGYPARPGRDPEPRPAEEWIAAADRKPFDEVVERR